MLRSATTAITAPRPASKSITRRRRSSRSITTPLKGIISIAGMVAFRRAKTTVNPVKASLASSLVIRGVYRYTRNPMYVGLLLTLLAWAVFLANPLAVLWVVVYVLYITRFQIIPEERVLASLFGAEYEAYKGRVRRWI